MEGKNREIEVHTDTIFCAVLYEMTSMCEVKCAGVQVIMIKTSLELLCDSAKWGDSHGTWWFHSAHLG